MSCVAEETAVAGHRLAELDESQDRVRPVFSRLAVATNPAEIAEIWHDLEMAAPISPYQTWAFVEAWLRTEGIADGLEPMLVTAFDAAGRPIALLPFVVRRRGSVHVAAFCGGKHSNYNMGLFRSGIAWTREDLLALLRGAARTAATRVDVFSLVNQPHRWRGAINPLALIAHQASPSSSHRACLSADADAYFKDHHSAHARKVLRGKRRKLEALGVLDHLVARTPEQIQAVLTAFLAQKSSRLDAQGLPDDLHRPSVRAFFERLAMPAAADLAPTLEMHALLSGDRIVATFAGLVWDKRFSGLLISHDHSDDLARTSPGEQLLVEVIRRKCEQGFDSLDLGVGEARYKDVYCRIEDPLFDSFVPITVRGWAWRIAQALALRAKRSIKQSPLLWAGVQRARKVLRRAGR